LKRLLPLLLILLFSVAHATSIDEFYWEPEDPQVGDNITVYARITGNVSDVRFQYCINSTGACYYPTMIETDGLWETVVPGNHVQKDSIELKLNVTGAPNEYATQTKYVTVTGDGNGTPGFELFLAFVALILLVKIKSKK
jgi:hypothetical protein